MNLQSAGMHFGFATLTEHEQEAKLLQERFKTSRTVPGTHKIHSVVSVATNLIEARPFSYSKSSRKEKVAMNLTLLLFSLYPWWLCHCGI